MSPVLDREADNGSRTRVLPEKPLIRGHITPLLITFNEIANIERTISRLAWASQIVVVDSGSTDGTLELLKKCERVTVLHRRFDSFAAQCQFGLGAIKSEWALSMDADYVLSDELVTELSTLRDDPAVAGYETPFKYYVWGKPLSATLYPPRTVLYRVARAKYFNEGHGHRVRIDGAVCRLKASIFHDDRKTLSRWLAAQQRYAAAEAEHLLSVSTAELSRSDRIRLRVGIAPLLVFCYVLFWKRCVFNGRRGWFYALQRLFAEVIIALEINDRRSQRDSRPAPGSGGAD
jgi:glycosyltransferase involved in cell wall biosynthesis